MLVSLIYPRYNVDKAKYDNFFSDESLALWNYVCKRPFLVDKFIDDQSSAEVGMVTFLKEQKLYKAASFAKGFRPVLVHEFFSNLSSQVSDSTSGWYHQLYVRGQMVSFSPAEINKILGCSDAVLSYAFPSDFPLDFDCLISEITGNKMVSWPNDSKFPASSLRLKYYVLYKIAANNWLPFSHTTSVFKEMASLLYAIGRRIPFDLGHIIFTHIETFAGSKATTINLPYPCLLTNLLLKNGVFCEDYEESVLAKPLKISRRIFAPDKVNDLRAESTATSQSPTPVHNSTESSLLMFLQDSLHDLITRRQNIDMQLQQLQEERRALGHKEVHLQSLIRSFSGSTTGCV